MSSRVVFKFLLCIDDISQPHAQRAPRKSGTMRFVREKLQYSVSIHVKNLTSLSSVRAGALSGVFGCCKIPKAVFRMWFFRSGFPSPGRVLLGFSVFVRTR
jgi:hypothetical protein